MNSLAYSFFFHPNRVIEDYPLTLYKKNLRKNQYNLKNLRQDQEHRTWKKITFATIDASRR